MKSMTGYGKASHSTPFGTIEVELKSFNHRYLNISYRSDQFFSSHEFEVTRYLQKAMARGSVRVHIRFHLNKAVSLNEVVLQEDLAKQYYKILSDLKDNFSLSGQITPADFLHCPGIFVLQEKENPVLNTSLNHALDLCLKNFDDYRKREGKQLQQHLEQVLDKTSQMVLQLEKECENLLPRSLEKFRIRLEQYSRQIPQVNEERLIQEAIFFCDKADISEEMVRLQAHIKEMRTSFKDSAPVGRKLDFIAQECFREINTIGAKVNQYSSSKIALELKSELEKIREQIQNIE